jgi:hypothetical protein
MRFKIVVLDENNKATNRYLEAIPQFKDINRDLPAEQ